MIMGSWLGDFFEYESMRLRENLFLYIVTVSDQSNAIKPILTDWGKQLFLYNIYLNVLTCLR